MCSHCGYSGHLKDKCFQLIGYPPGWKGLRGKRFISTAQPENLVQRLPIANNVSSLEQDASNPNMIFSQEQIQNLITLANSLSNTNPNPVANVASASCIPFICYTATTSKNSFSWILDTGTIVHMICCPDFFTSINMPNKHSKVHLPNGQYVPIIFTGHVDLSPDIKLHNALYVPAFNVNLIFSSQLTKDN